MFQRCSSEAVTARASSALLRCFSASASAARTCASNDSRRRRSSPSKSRSLPGSTTWTVSEVSSPRRAYLCVVSFWRLFSCAIFVSETEKNQLGNSKQRNWKQWLKELTNCSWCQSFAMGVNVLTPVDRIAGFSGRTMGTGRGNFWIICTTSNDDGGTFTHSKKCFEK